MPRCCACHSIAFLIPGIFPGTLVSSFWEINTFKPCPCFYCCVKYLREKVYFRGFYDSCLASMTAQKYLSREMWPKKAAKHMTTRKQRECEEGNRTKGLPQRHTLKDLNLPDRGPSPNNTELWSHGSIGEFSCQIDQIPHDPVPSQLGWQV